MIKLKIKKLTSGGKEIVLLIKYQGPLMVPLFIYLFIYFMNILAG